MIPCKRPRVTIEAHEIHLAISGRTATYHLVTCNVPGCDFTYDAAVATDAADQAIWHRRAHRDAVPATSIDRAGDGHRWAASCGTCLRVETRGTRTDAQAWLDHHLSAIHGLVSC